MCVASARGEVRELLGKKRGTGSLRGDAFEQRLRRFVAEDRSGDGARRASRDGTKIDANMVPTRKPLRSALFHLGAEELGPRHRQHQKRLMLGTAERMLDEAQRLVVGPLHV